MVSIIISFSNEPRHTLHRTLFSIFYRTPEELVAEIILADDASDDGRSRLLISANVYVSRFPPFSETIGTDLAGINKVVVMRNTRKQGQNEIMIENCS